MPDNFLASRTREKSENWRDIGGKVWVDKRVLLRHTGTYVFDFAAQEQVYKELHAMAMANGAAAPVDNTGQATTQYAPQQVVAAPAPAEVPKPVKGKSLKKKETAKA